MCLCDKASFCWTRCLWAQECPLCWWDCLRFVTASTVGCWNRCPSIFPITSPLWPCHHLSQYRISPVPGGAENLQQHPAPTSCCAYYVYRLRKHFYCANLFSLEGCALLPWYMCVAVWGRLVGEGSLLLPCRSLVFTLRPSSLVTRIFTPWAQAPLLWAFSFSCTWISDPCVIFFLKV